MSENGKKLQEIRELVYKSKKKEIWIHPKNAEFLLTVIDELAAGIKELKLHTEPVTIGTMEAEMAGGEHLFRKKDRCITCDLLHKYNLVPLSKYYKSEEQS